MKVATVAEGFASYRQSIIPDNAPPVQVEECRRAFYAGAYLTLMNGLVAIGDQSTSEEEGVEQLEKLKQECEAFAAELSAPPPPPKPNLPPEFMMDPSSGYTVRSDQIESLLRELGRDLKAKMPPGWLFTLFIVSAGQAGLPGEGPGGASFYISTANREDMVKALKEFIARQQH